jgi:hypothetical protein
MKTNKVNVPLGRNELLILLTAFSEVYTELYKNSTKEGRQRLEALMDTLCYKLHELKNTVQN